MSSIMSMSMSMNEPQTTARMPVNGMMLPPSEPTMEEEEDGEDFDLPPQFNAPGNEVFFHPQPSLLILFLIVSFPFFSFSMAMLLISCYLRGFVNKRPF